MKVQSVRKRPQANKIFTDREEPRESFWNNYTHYKEQMQDEEEVKVLSYYGIGGIGKTKLLHKLQEEMRERFSKPKYVYFDFNIAQDSRSVLDYLKTKLKKDYGYEFPLYELGVYSFAQKIGEDMDSPQIKGFIERSPLLSFVVSAVGAIPAAGVVAQIADATDRGIVYIRTLIENNEREIKDIENKTPDELYDYLPYLFAQDMTNNRSNDKKVDNEPMVVFFDTYERLVNEMSSVGESLNNDLWLRSVNGLILNTKYVLWVIAGRETLKWERFNAAWHEELKQPLEQPLEQHLLGNLSRTDANSFLKSAGISDERLREGIYDLTKGTPVYLDLCVDRYTSLLEQGKTPVLSDFGKTESALIERFIRYMDDSRKDIVYMLSCMKIWNDIMVTDLGAKIIPGFRLTTYEKIKDFSFVTKSDKYNYNIHQTIGDTLFVDCPQVIKDSVRKCVVPYCEERLNKSGTFDPVYVYHLQWLTRFGLLHYENDDNFIDFYNKHLEQYLKRLAVSGKALLAEHIFEPVMIRANKTGDSLLKALALSESSFWKHKKGEFAVSVVLASESVELYEKFLGNENEVTLKAKHRLGERLRSNGEYQRSYEVLSEVLFMRKALSMPLDEEEVDVRDDIVSTMLYLGKYKEALPFVQETLTMREQLPHEEKPSSYNTLWNLGDLYSCLGRYKDALPICKKLCEKSRELMGERHLNTVKAINQQAKSLSYLGQHQEALELYEKVLALRKEILGERHPDTVQAMYNLALSLSYLGRHQKALELSKEVLVLRKEILGKKHPSTINAMQVFAGSLYKVGRYQEALALYKEVLELRKEVLGAVHPDTVGAMYNVALSLSKIGQHQEALALRKEVLPLFKEKLGDKHPYSIDAKENLAVSLSDLGRYQEALTLNEEVLALRKEILGEKHPHTLNAMNNLANTLSKLERCKDALALRRDVLELRKEILGERHPDTIQAMYNVAYELNKAGHTEESCAFFQETLKKQLEVLKEDDQIINRTMENLIVLFNKLKRYDEKELMEKELLKREKNCS